VSLVVMFADKGSPGVTTLALAVASVWPRRVALAELDPAGGDLALRLTDHAGRPVIRPALGLLTFAAAVRDGGSARPGLIWDHGQPLPARAAAAGGPVLLAGVRSPEQGAGMAALWPGVNEVLTTVVDGDVIADLGRLSPDSPALGVVPAADVLVGVAQASPDGVVRLRDRLAIVQDGLPTSGVRPRRVLAVLVADDKRGPDAVAATRTILARAGMAHVVVAGFLAQDPTGVRALLAGQVGPRLDRSLLIRSARSLASTLDRACTPNGLVEAAEASSAPSLVRPR
jgi:hypothetical protein